MNMFKDFVFVPHFNFADGDGSDGGAKAEDEGKGETVTKEDHDKQVEELKTQVKQLRDEVVSPDYLEFLENKEKPDNAKKADVPKDKDGKPDQITILQNQVKELKDNIGKASDAQTQKEIQSFADAHEDFEELKPIMIGVSANDKFKNASLSTLYKEAKKYVEKKEASIKESLTKKKPSSEKPAGSGEGFDPNKKYSATDAAREAANEIEAAGGTF